MSNLFDCSACLHGRDSRDHAWCHQREDFLWYDCNNQPCPNASDRHTSPLPIPAADHSGSNFVIYPIDSDLPPVTQHDSNPASTSATPPLPAPAVSHSRTPAQLQTPMSTPPPTTEQLVHALVQQVAALTASLQNSAPSHSSMNKLDPFKEQSTIEA